MQSGRDKARRAKNGHFSLDVIFFGFTSKGTKDEGRNTINRRRDSIRIDLVISFTGEEQTMWRRRCDQRAGY